MSSCAAVLLATCWTTVAEAREPETYSIDIPAARLPEAIAELSRDAGVSIGSEGSLPPLATPALHGRMSVAEALSRLLAGSGYVARQVGASAWRIERANAGAGQATTHRPVTDALSAAVPTEGEPIVVTGTKRKTPLDDLPMAISLLLFTPARSANPGNGTALVAAESEGLAMTSLGPGRNRLFLHGIADSPFNGETQSTVAVVLDDARLTYTAPDPDIRLVDVERVEVLKGPQGSLYGSGALGGIYHIVTRRADVSQASLAASGGGDAVAHGGMGWSASAVGNLPLVQDVAALRMVGYAAQEAGWVDTGSRKDSNDTRLLGARANMGVELPGGGWRADLSGLLQFLKSRDSRYVYAPGARTRPGQLPEPHDNDMRHLTARLSREGDGMDLTLSTGVTWHEVGDTLDATVGADSFGLSSPSLLEDERRYRVWDSEARVSDHAGKLGWLVGVSHVEARQNALWTLQSFTGASQVIDDDRRRTYDTALFGDVTMPLVGRLSLDAGARLFTTTTVETRNLAGATISRERRRSGMTPSFALSWKPGRGQIVYLRYASAYREGGSDIAPGGEVEILKSDELATLEVGWRREIGQDGHLELGLYASRWENLQSDLLLPNGLIESANAGNARILGGEATLDLPLSGSMRFEAGANYTDALLTRSMLGTQLDDRRLPVVPRFTARTALTHSFVLGSAKAQIRMALRYVGPQRLSFDPAIDRPMGSYLESRIEAQVKLGKITLMIDADNLFGSADDSFAFGNPLRFATSRQYTPQRPATLSLKMAKEF